ncbi:unnamed protein product, partial [Mesorhabditis spiculigera]
MDAAIEDKVLGLRTATASKILLVTELIFCVLLAGVVLVNLFSALTWLPFLMNSVFLVFNATSLILLTVGLRRKLPLHFLPILSYETVSISWTLVWLYACYTSGIEGHLWPLEWLGGPQSSREPQVTDVRDARYHDKSQTDPETKRALNLSGFLLVMFMLLFATKLLLWILAKHCFVVHQNEAVRQAMKFREFDPMRQLLDEEEEPKFTVVYNKDADKPTRVLRQASNAHITGQPTSPGSEHSGTSSMNDHGFIRAVQQWLDEQDGLRQGPQPSHPHPPAPLQTFDAQVCFF